MDTFPDKYNEACKIPTKTKEVNIPEAVKKYELSGGSIMNVVHYAGIKAVERLQKEIASRPGKNGILVEYLVSTQSKESLEYDECNPEPKLIIYLSHVLDAIKREMLQEGKPFA